MQLESHATPTRESPAQRHAALQRAIERGLESDELWKDLAETSLELGHHDEAIRCLRRIHSPALRNALQSQLARAGLIDEPGHRTHGRHAAAPAASDAGPARRERPAAAPDEPVLLRELAADAAQFLFWQHMPWLCLLTTLSFPVIVGLGGFLTAGGSAFGLAAIAAVPGLGVLAVVGAMGRRILIAGQQGLADAPELPSLGTLAADALRFLRDAVLVLAALLLPSLAALLLDSPPLATLPGALFGVWLLPLAWGLRQVRGDLGALSPVVLLRGACRGGRGYLGLAALCWAMFAPAVVVGWAVHGKPVWVQVAAIGPLVVLPLFAASRLIGTWLDTRRDDLAVVLQSPRARAAKASARAAPATPQPATAGPGTRAGLRHLAPPRAHHHRADSERHHALRQRATATPAAARPAAAAPAAPAVASEPAPAPRAIEGRGPRREPPVADAPDLTHMPGAVVVTGQERVRQGAAAKVR